MQLRCPMCGETVLEIDVSGLVSMEGIISLRGRCHNRRRCAGRPLITWRIRNGRVERAALTAFRVAS